MDVNSVYNQIIKTLEENDKSTEEMLLKPNSNYYSVYISTSVAFRIKLGRKKYIEVKSRYEDLINDDVISSKIKSVPDWVRIEINSENDILKISNVILEIYDTIFEAIEQFGCCHRFLECSNKKEYVHPDKKRAKGCAYKENLEAGRIFYGKNANLVKQRN